MYQSPLRELRLVDPSVVYKGGDRVFIYVNQRPINYVKSELKDLVTCIKDKHREAIGLGESNKKNPFMYVDIQIQPDEYDGKIWYKIMMHYQLTSYFQ